MENEKNNNMNYLKVSEELNKEGYYNKIVTKGSGINALMTISLGIITTQEFINIKTKYLGINFKKQ